MVKHTQHPPDPIHLVKADFSPPEWEVICSILAVEPEQTLELKCSFKQIAVVHTGESRNTNYILH